MREVNLLTCPWGPQNPERKEKDTRVRKQADLENTKCPENGISRGVFRALICQVWRENRSDPRQYFVLLCHQADRVVLEKHMLSDINLWM